MSQNSTITAKYEEKWALLEEEFLRVKQASLLPFSFTDIDGTTATRTEKDFSDQLNTLKEEKFTISVCGIVKAGKSTFLNALLFGEDILPAFDTPMTAKLNFIEYTEEKNHFIINFYSASEWEELHKSLDEENSRQLNARIRLCAEVHGIYKDHCIDAPSCRETNLKRLEEYVSDPKTKNGKFTPFVKDVHIFINNDSIRDVRIVDTPGLNDPNIINSRETTKWIKNTHALIFLLPPKSLDASSLNFFDTHLLGTRPTNRIWVINKIDDIGEEDFRKSVAYLHNLGTQEDFRKKNLFGRDEKICGYSALIAMLRHMYDNGIALNENQNFHLDEVGDDFNPDPDDLVEAVGERLYQNTGVKRIIAGFTAIDTLYSQHITAANKTILFCEMAIADNSKDDQELQREINIIHEKQQEFKTQLENFERELSDVVFRAISENLIKPTNRGIDRLSAKMTSEIDCCINAQALRNIPYIFRDECEKIFGPYGILAEGVQTCSEALSSELAAVRLKIKRLFAQNEIEGSINFAPIDEITAISFTVDDLTGDLSSSVRNALPSNWFTEVFTSKSTMRELTKGLILDALAKTRENMGTNAKVMQTKVMKQIATSFEAFNSSIEESCIQKKQILETGKEEREKALKKAKAELDEATRRKVNIEEMQRSFKHQFPQEIWTASK